MLKFVITLVFVFLIVVATGSDIDVEEDGEDDERGRVLNLERRALPSFHTLAECNCTGLNSTISADSQILVQCCNYYSKCCPQSREVSCPVVDFTGVAATASVNECNKYGPFCRNTDDCFDGRTKCCTNTNGKSPVAKYKCCWVVT